MPPSANPAHDHNSPPMTRLMIVAHAPLATALRAVAAHAFPDGAERIEAFDVAPTDAPEVVSEHLRQALALAGEAQVLVMCDAMGATPCNAAQRVAQEGRVHVLAGVNVPMLWRALCYADEPLNVLTQRALLGASGGVLVVPPLASVAHDPEDRHHQQ